MSADRRSKGCWGDGAYLFFSSTPPNPPPPPINKPAFPPSCVVSTPITGQPSGERTLLQGSQIGPLLHCALIFPSTLIYLPLSPVSVNGLIPFPAVNARSLSHYHPVPSSPPLTPPPPPPPPQPQPPLKIKSCKLRLLPLLSTSHRCPHGSTLLAPIHLGHTLSSTPVRMRSCLSPACPHFAARARGSKPASHQDSFPYHPRTSKASPLFLG